MTWEIALGIIALVGFIATIGSMVWKLSSLLSRLESAVKALTEAVESLKNDNRGDHEKIFENIKDHEERIFKLEIKAKG